MITCRKCGAETAAGAKFCQMCAATLAATEDKPVGQAKSVGRSLSTTVVFSADFPEPHTCPICDSINDAEWVFCQQCGSKLDQPAAQTPADHPADQNESGYAATVQVSQSVEKPSKPKASHNNCPKCSQPVMEGAAFCYKCGTAISSSTTVVMASVRPSSKARLLLIVEGEETGDEYVLKGETVIGRTTGDITFPHDDYMSGRHARVVKRGDRFMLIDEDSRNGSFVRIKKEAEIRPGDFILLGKQLFRFEV